MRSGECESDSAFISIRAHICAGLGRAEFPARCPSLSLHVSFSVWRGVGPSIPWRRPSFSLEEVRSSWSQRYSLKECEGAYIEHFPRSSAYICSYKTCKVLDETTRCVAVWRRDFFFETATIFSKRREVFDSINSKFWAPNVCLWDATSAYEALTCLPILSPPTIFCGCIYRKNKGASASWSVSPLEDDASGGRCVTVYKYRL